MIKSLDLRKNKGKITVSLEKKVHRTTCAEMRTNMNEEKRLRKSSTNRKIAGVCGGVGEYLNIDPTVIRLVWVLAAFCLGSGLLAYIIAAIIMPD